MASEEGRDRWRKRRGLETAGWEWMGVTSGNGITASLS